MTNWSCCNLCHYVEFVTMATIVYSCNYVTQWSVKLKFYHLFFVLLMLKLGVHLIVTIVTIAVIVQKQSISAIAERSLSHVHLIVPIVQKNFQDHIFWREIEINIKWTSTAVHLGKYDDRSDRSRSLAYIHMITAIVTIVTIAEAIAGIEPDLIPAIAIVTIVTIAGIINCDVSIWSLWSLTDFSAIVAIVTIKWTPGLSHIVKIKIIWLHMAAKLFALLSFFSHKPRFQTRTWIRAIE